MAKWPLPSRSRCTVRPCRCGGGAGRAAQPAQPPRDAPASQQQSEHWLRQHRWANGMAVLRWQCCLCQLGRLVLRWQCCLWQLGPLVLRWQCCVWQLGPCRVQGSWQHFVRLPAGTRHAWVLPLAREGDDSTCCAAACRVWGGLCKHKHEQHSAHRRQQQQLHPCQPHARRRQRRQRRQQLCCCQRPACLAGPHVSQQRGGCATAWRGRRRRHGCRVVKECEWGAAAVTHCGGGGKLLLLLAVVAGAATSLSLPFCGRIAAASHCRGDCCTPYMQHRCTSQPAREQGGSRSAPVALLLLPCRVGRHPASRRGPKMRRAGHGMQSRSRRRESWRALPALLSCTKLTGREAAPS